MVIAHRAYKFLRSSITAIFILLLKLYRLCISPLLPGSCRFYPSCSQYSMEALSRYGPWIGLLLTLRRLMKCHPFHDGGIDPVPESYRFNK